MPQNEPRRKSYCILEVTSIKKDLPNTIATPNVAIIKSETIKLKWNGGQAYFNVININTYEK